MPEIDLDIRNPSGLHARPAATFVKAASEFGADVRVTNLTRDAGREAPARSLLSVLALGVLSGHRIRISAEGDDAQDALDRLRDLVESGLGEPLEEGPGP